MAVFLIYRAYLNFIVPPKALNSRLEVRGVKGQPLTLDCTVLAVPVPEVTWFKLGERGKTSLSPPNKTFRIRSLQLDDAGGYECTASNYLGSVTVNVQVLVAG